MSCSLCRRSIVAENEYVGGKGGLTSHVSGCGLYEGASYVHTPCIIELHTDHSQAHVIHHVCKFVFPGVNSLFRPAPRRTHAWCRAAGGVAPPRAGPPAVGGHTAAVSPPTWVLGGHAIANRASMRAPMRPLVHIWLTCAMSRTWAMYDVDYHGLFLPPLVGARTQ